MDADAIRAVLTDRQAVALTIFGEARAEGLAGQVAVACVIRNRVAHPRRFGASWREVCLRKLQFSCWWPVGGAANYAAVMAMAERLASGVTPTPRSAMAHCLWVADGVLSNATPDLTKGADHYLTATLLHTAPPKWAAPPVSPVAAVGAHVFFRLVA